jgi:hypothetical protein
LCAFEKEISMVNDLIRRHLLGLLVLACSACSSSPTALMPIEPDAIFTVQGAAQQQVVRVLTRATVCPGIEWDGQAAIAMSLRAAPATIPVRGDSAQSDSKEAVFNVRTCEAVWPAGIKQARVAGHSVPAPRADIQRIVIVADTGCRMKASESAFQPCNDPGQWPFAQVAQSAAALKPDLVIHIGDMHYRESPCPAGNPGCANSPWGYGYDTWQADFFSPAKPLLAAAPWVFVRGNHESCWRAGQGWFRWIDSQPWREARSCNKPENDDEADYSEPYAVPVSAQTQLIVFDSSKTSGKPFKSSDLAYGKYMQQLKKLTQQTQQKSNSFFMSHHPLQATAPVKNPGLFKSGGNEGMQSVFGALYPERLFPAGVSLALHGHIHLFESISFKGNHPASLVLGNSGSVNEGVATKLLPPNAQLYGGAQIEEYVASDDYGFATLDRVESSNIESWLLTEYTVAGQAVMTCKISGGTSRCNKL